MLKRLVITALSFICVSGTVQAKKITKHEILTPTDSILPTIDERYAELSQYSPNIRPQIKKEVQRFRISAKALDRERRELQESLSKEAQEYLKSEQRFRRHILEIVEGKVETTKVASTDTTPIYQAVIQDFQSSIANFDADIRDEIRDYRKLLLEIRQRKRRLYNNLSLGAQEYLAEEKEFRKRSTTSLE